MPRRTEICVESGVAGNRNEVHNVTLKIAPNTIKEMELLLEGSLYLMLLVVVVGALAYHLVRSLPTSQLFPKWVSTWLVISSIICVWDASFVLLRPASFDMVLWAPYADYIQVDKLYGNVEDSFVWSQSILNLLEVALNLYTLSLVRTRQFRAASVMAVVVSTMTSSKTVLYHVMEYACGFCNSAHNDAATLVLLYFLPNGVWIWVPAFVVFHLGGKLSSDSLHTKRKKK